MPVYIALANLIIPKQVIEHKYYGGLEAFFDHFKHQAIQEDDALLSITRMNVDEFDIAHLVSNGLSYGDAGKGSEDFVIILRYGGALWPVDWLTENTVFAWHKSCSQEQVDKALAISAMRMDDIAEQYERGNDLFQAIRATES